MLKYIIFFISLIIFGIIGLAIEIEKIRTDEYSQFDKSPKAINDALVAKTIDDYYLPLYLVLHLIFLLFIVRKKFRKS